MAPPLVLRGITRTFGDGENVVEVLRGVDLTVAAGELVALVGPSGAGKSTLLQIAGLLDRPTAGSVEICGEDAARIREVDRTAMRRDRIGFVYQFHHLLGDFTARENVALPLREHERLKKNAILKRVAEKQSPGIRHVVQGPNARSSRRTVP